jgi:glycosyltransferase involved in cell wall biosynthesis
MKKPLLSILIATKNRIPYCIQVIEKILKYPNQDFELVIQDNSDSLDLFDYVKGIIDSRFVYNYTPPPFSSIHNFNKVISLSKGKYLCLIGDDDCVSPEIFNLVRWANKKNIDSIVPSLSAVYWWPDATIKIKEKEKDNGHLEIRKISLEIKEYSTIGEVEKLMKSGAQNYMELNLPKLYHGIVKRKYLDLIKYKTGNFIGGLSPDIYLAVALSTYIKNIIKIDYPITIPGICKKSTSYDSVTYSNTGRLEDAPHFRDRGKYIWAKEVPRYYSGINIWADSALAALTDLEEFSNKKKFNVTNLVLLSLTRNQGDKNDLIKYYLDFNNADGLLNEKYYIFKLYILKYKFTFSTLFTNFFTKIKRLLTTKTNSARFKNIINISEALSVFNSYMKSNKISLKYDIEKINNNN